MSLGDVELSSGKGMPTFDFMYAAITARDKRFDGQFYTAVTSTRIYCRPSCPATKPHQRNVLFYATAAGAQAAGFRACRRCIPDATPGSPSWNIHSSLAHRAMRLIEDGVVDRDGVDGVAARLGYTTRHVNRILTSEFGASILALARAHRAHRAQTARKLLTETDLPVTEIAYMSGFSSIRQFNVAVQQIFSQTPSEIRARSKRAMRTSATSGEITLALPYREPFNFDHLLHFYAARAVEGVELVDGDSYTRSLLLPHGPALATVRDEGGSVRLSLRYAHVSDLSAAVSRVRRMLDLDADPLAVDQVLSADSTMVHAVRRNPGLQLPGSVHPHETLFRAIIGQQITVSAATQMLAGMSARMPELGFGGPVDRLFPSAAFMATVGHEMFRGPASRREALRLAAERLLEQPNVTDFAQEQSSLIDVLLSFKGVGPWTAAYVAMRVLSAPDIFLLGDAAVRAGAEQLGLAGELEEIASHFQPWRSYLTLHLWNAASEGSATRSSIRADSRQSGVAADPKLDVREV